MPAGRIARTLDIDDQPDAAVHHRRVLGEDTLQ